MTAAEKNDVKNTMQIHSQAKVEFYKKYLERYLVILCAAPSIKHINIYDVFCGMGIYDDGKKGSPIVAYETISELYNCGNIKPGTEITLIINDKEKDRIDKVMEYISKHEYPYCKVEPYNLDIEEMFQEILPRINDSSSDTRNLVFIDPYGYKNISRNLICGLMENRKTEIILFLPISHMQRFTDVAVKDEKEMAQYKPLRDFIDGFFPDLNHPIRQNTVSVKEYIRYVTEALRLDSDIYTTSFYLERDKNKSTFFALFFISPNIYGFEKILEVKWGLDEEAGRGFNIPERIGDLFEKEMALESKQNNALRLKKLLEEHLSKGRTNKEVYEFVLRNEFLPKHANEVLKSIQKENPKFKVYDMTRDHSAQKGAFYIKHNPTKLVIMEIEQ